jgi:hypothetical protein
VGLAGKLVMIVVHHETRIRSRICRAARLCRPVDPPLHPLEHPIADVLQRHVDVGTIRFDWAMTSINSSETYIG